MNTPRNLAGRKRAGVAAVQAFLQSHGAHWLERQRWFADKGRAISGLGIEDVLVESVDGTLLALCVTIVRFEEGGQSRYLLPLAANWRWPKTGHGPETVLDFNESFVDATDLDWFGSWLLGRMLDDTSPARTGWAFSLDEPQRECVERHLGSASRHVGAEQSNTSLRIGDELIFKVIRRLQPGPNPEEEILRALAEQQFPHVPPYVGAASWVRADDLAYPVAIGQRFVPNHGDGWSWMLRRLEGIRSLGDDAGTLDLEPERLLGQRTAELHRALARVSKPGFAPLRHDVAQVAVDRGRTLRQLEEVVTLLDDRARLLPNQIQPLLPRIIKDLRGLARSAEDYQDEEGTLSIRVHGDYHLGQVLRTRDDDWSIIDFEGEPVRSVEERRQRTSALKDVAGMLRSFSYARAARGLASPHEQALRNRRSLAAWEHGARNAFLTGYREAITGDGLLVPGDDAAFSTALRAWEIDKALYEVAYEARNRPDWLILPLRSLLPWIGDQLDGDVGGAPA